MIDPNISSSSKLFNRQIRNTIVKNGPKNPVTDIILPRGFPAAFEEGTIPSRNDIWPQYMESVEVKNFVLQNEVVAKSGWSSKSLCEIFISKGFMPIQDGKGQQTRFVLTRTGAIETIKERSDLQSHVISVLRGLGTTQQASAILKKIGINFSYPKPVGLLKHLISMVRGDDFLVLDSFAGSGTTAQAVQELNESDGGHRRFILVEMDQDIACGVTTRRLKNAICGYGDTPGLGGGFQFCTLSEPLFDAQGRLCEAVTFGDLARHIFFTETGQPMSYPPNAGTTLIGTANGIAYHLLWQGSDEEKILDSAALRSLLPNDGIRVVYADGCRLSPQRLKQANIVFKQIPYEVKTS